MVPRWLRPAPVKKRTVSACAVEWKGKELSVGNCVEEGTASANTQVVYEDKSLVVSKTNGDQYVGWGKNNKDGKARLGSWEEE